MIACLFPISQMYMYTVTHKGTQVWVKYHRYVICTGCKTGSCFGSKVVQKKSSLRAEKSGIVAGRKMAGVLHKKNKQPVFFLKPPALPKPGDFNVPCC